MLNDRETVVTEFTRWQGGACTRALARSVLAAAVASLLPVCGAAAQAALPEEEQDVAHDAAAAVEDDPGRTRDEADAPEPTAATAATELAPITVTGTRIRGGATPSPVITIGSEDIRDEGFSDLGQVIRSVPQNFSGGQNPEVPGGNMLGGGLANQNVTGGSGLNLRGLGPDASLTLLNGRRMAYGGFWNTVDISAIPVEAVERIEIVADGASAIYGSDAVGGVGNVILKRDFEGVMLGARHGSATDGGLATRQYSATAGATWAGGGLIAAYMDVLTDPIEARDRRYTEYLPEPRTLISGSDLNSGVLSAYQGMGSVAELRLDLLHSKRRQDTYFVTNLLPQYTRATPETTSTLVSPSVEFFLPGDWRLTVGGAWGEGEHRQTQSTVASGTGVSTVSLDDCYCNNTRAFEVGMEGSLFALPGGDLGIAFGGGYRTNEFTQHNYLAGTTPIEGEESSRFAYAEVNLPLVGSDSTVRGVQRLELTAALRGEDYDSFGSVTTPKLGVIYGPNADFTFKLSWGRSFKAPTLFQLNQAQFVLLMPAAYFGGAGYAEDATAMLVGGGNRELQPERARTWTASMVFHPEAVRGLTLGLTWFDIDYVDRVVQPITNPGQALGNPIYETFIDPFPDAATQEDVIAGAGSFVNGTGVAYDPGDVAALIHYEYTNVARQEIRGMDLSGSYGFDLAGGRANLRGSATWMDSTQTTSPAQEPFDLSGTLFNPAKVSGRIGGTWSRGGFTAGGFLNYTGRVLNTLTGEKPGSFTTFDATLRYATADGAGVFSGMEFAFSVQNMLDREPPLYTPASLVYSTPYDPTNYSAIGRFLSLSVSKHF